MDSLELLLFAIFRFSWKLGNVCMCEAGTSADSIEEMIVISAIDESKIKPTI